MCDTSLARNKIQALDKKNRIRGFHQLVYFPHSEDQTSVDDKIPPPTFKYFTMNLFPSDSVTAFLFFFFFGGEGKVQTKQIKFQSSKIYTEFYIFGTDTEGSYASQFFPKLCISTSRTQESLDFFSEHRK